MSGRRSMKEYNEARSRGAYCFGKTPWRPRVAQEKQIVTLQVFKYQIFLSRRIKIVLNELWLKHLRECPSEKKLNPRPCLGNENSMFRQPCGSAEEPPSAGLRRRCC
jgi:hypothetical protein